jgi:radical SAM superfamily enzyme YgiQ (UPF0313 family)
MGISSNNNPYSKCNHIYYNNGSKPSPTGDPMKILLILTRFNIDPFMYNEYSTDKFYGYLMPMGLGYISATLKKNNYDVEILNLNHIEGTCEQIISDKVSKTFYDVILTGGVSMYYPNIRDYINYIRKASPKSIIVVGGGLVSAQPEIMFGLLKPDYGVISEGEQTVLELIKYIEDGKIGNNNCIDGIIFKDFRMPINKVVTVVNKPRQPIMDLDNLPYPDFEGFGYKEFLDNERPTYIAYDSVDVPRMYPILGSRSCPLRCLSGDTLIETTNGKIKIQDLVGQSPKVLTRDPVTKDALYAQSSMVAQTGTNEELVRVKFKEGTHIDCTPDHKFVKFLSGNAYVPTREFEVEACNLKTGDHVRAVHYEIKGLGYTDIVWGRRKRNKQHILILESMLNRKLVSGEMVHHIDHNPKNNIESNLLLTDKYNHSPDHHPEVSQRMRDNNPAKNLPHEFFVNLGKSQKGKQRSDESRLRYSESKMGKKNPNYKEGLCLGKSKRVHDILLPEVNHVIESVEPIAKGDTYCLEVPGYDWFYANDVLVHNCTFCYHTIGNKYRHRTIDNIISEMKYAIDHYQVNIFFFYDELFAYDKERALDFCTKLRALMDTVPYKIWVNLNLRVDCAEEEVIDALKTINCNPIGLGLESYSQTILDSMKKHTTPEQIKKTLTLISSKDIATQGAFIFGDPAETLETAQETLDFFIDHQDLIGSGVSIGFVIPFQGSPLYKHCVKSGIIKDEIAFIEDRAKNGYNFSHPINMTKLSDADFEILKDRVFTAFYTAGYYSIPKIKVVDGKDEFHIKCPYCKKESVVKNINRPKMLELPTIGCRHCLRRFMLVTPFYPFLRAALKMFGFNKLYVIKSGLRKIKMSILK